MRVAHGDTIWIVGLDESKHLFTIGHLVVERIVEQGEARRLLGDDIYDARYYALPKDNQETLVQRIDLTRIVDRLTFMLDERPARLAIENEEVSAQQLQALRQFTTAGAALMRLHCVAAGVA